MMEKEIQDFLMEEGSFSCMETKFETSIYFVESEFTLGNERIDILGVDCERTLYVIEIKKGTIDANAYVQCKNYMIGLERLLEFNDMGHDIMIKGILVGEDIEQKRVTTLIAGDEDIDFVKFKRSFDFKSKQFSINEEFYTDKHGKANAILGHIDDHEETEELEEGEE